MEVSGAWAGGDLTPQDAIKNKEMTINNLEFKSEPTTYNI